MKTKEKIIFIVAISFLISIFFSSKNALAAYSCSSGGVLNGSTCSYRATLSGQINFDKYVCFQNGESSNCLSGAYASVSAFPGSEPIGNAYDNMTMSGCSKYVVSGISVQDGSSNGLPCIMGYVSPAPISGLNNICSHFGADSDCLSSAYMADSPKLVGGAYSCPIGGILLNLTCSYPATFTITMIDNATFVSYTDVPITVTPGQNFTASITMKNSGDTTWYKGASYILGSQNPRDNGTWGTGRIALPSDVAPGANGTFTATFTAPATPGTYNFQWQMLIEGVKWFGASSTNQVVSVTAPQILTCTPTNSVCATNTCTGGQCYDGCKFIDGTKTIGACCVADSSCRAANTCSGFSCVDSCGNSQTGTKNCSNSAGTWREVAP